MENLNQYMADKFWEKHFSDYIDNTNEIMSYDVNFWDDLYDALDSSDLETVHAVIFAKPTIPIHSGDVYTRIVRTAKRIWDKKQQ